MVDISTFFPPKVPKKIAKRQLELRDRLWPHVDTKWLWHRKERNGFITIPRCMSLICAIIDDLTPGQPASGVYLDIWTRAFDENFVTLSKSREMAFHSGFVGPRSERTWKQPMKQLADLGFLDIKPGPSGPISYALIKNPYLVIKELRASGNFGVTEEKYNALVERALEIGETSLDDDVPSALLIVPDSAAQKILTVPAAPPPPPPPFTVPPPPTA
jgi:hypothetical protein